MKKLSNFKDKKVDLKEIQGGIGGTPILVLSGTFVPLRPPGHPEGIGPESCVLNCDAYMSPV
ncbi:hypothetical protein [Algibacter sp. Ld11]|uniref:hypothetical protein n=1 Tax=Algibacter sp. Ld11 TaxID=649150 RepID=UPI00386E3DF8